MALRGHVFSKQLFSSDCCALLIDIFLNKNSGIIQGCELSNTNELIHIDNGYFLIKGRPLQEDGGTNITVETGDLSGIYCKLVCEIDMSKTNTTSKLNQVEYKIIEDITGYPKLIQEDITNGGTVYQFEFAKFRRTLNGIEDFVDTRSFLNFDSIYEEIRKEIANIETGSVYYKSKAIIVDKKINKNTNYEIEQYVKLEVYLEGCKLIKDENYIEIDSTHIQFKDWNVPVGSKLEFLYK